MGIDSINIISLAYLGDAVYEVYIREKLLNLGNIKVDELQSMATKYVSARGQAKILQELIDKNVFTDEEIDIIKRGRNYKRNTHPRHTDIITYKLATGFEALIGYLYLSGNIVRLKKILDEIGVK